MGFNAVLFDLDGTLLDTIGDLADSMNSVLSNLSLPSHDEETYKYFVGEGMENLVRRAIPESERSDPAMVARCLGLMREEYSHRWKARSKPYESIPELLDGLTARHKEMAILSNKPDNFTKLMVAELLSRWKFAVVLGESPSVPRKPDPVAAVEIARRLQIPPAEFLYLGDTSIDMRTAVAAGMYGVGVLWGFRKADELIAAGAKTLLQKPMDLLELLR
jgi:phosphoglycolate phosphatase